MQTTVHSSDVQPAASKNDPARFWDKIAERYARQPVADPAAFERKIALTKTRMTPQHVVLDIGCGTGSLALILAPSAKHVHGLDISSEMIRIARTKAQIQNTPNVTFHSGELCDALPFEPESLDGICAYSLLHLLEDPVAALTRVRRLLKPGGFFVASTMCLADSWVPYGPLIRAMRWVGKAPYVNIFSKSDVVGYLNGVGFTDVTYPDVGARSEVLFTLATNPGAAGATGKSRT
jgi:arsenite methyltransferase